MVMGRISCQHFIEPLKLLIDGTEINETPFYFYGYLTNNSVYYNMNTKSYTEILSENDKSLLLTSVLT